MSHYNYHRRTSIDKFNNRPPFDIKKMDDATSTENKEQSFCNNCEKIYMNTAAKSYINVAKYLEKFSDKYQTCVNNKNKNVIPKIIESFQKVAPKNNSETGHFKNKSESLETLFRNNRQTFGKMLPNHRLMKDLLKNFDDENVMKTSISYHQIDIAPSRDMSTNSFENTSNPKLNLAIRVDKETSTTGLHWPVVQNEIENCQSSFDQSKCYVTNNYFRKLKSKIPKRKELHTKHSYKFINNMQLNTNVDEKRSSDSSDLEYFPTKENSVKTADIISKIPLQTFKVADSLNKMAMDKAFPHYKYNVNQENFKRDNVLYSDKPRRSDGKIEINKKEKSFVQLQVEKFNKKHSHRNVHNRGLSSEKNLKTKELRDTKNNMNKLYISLMNSVRENLPKIEGKLVSDNENHEWSDKHINSNLHVRFPKETRNAMEHLVKNLKKVPLMQYVKCQNFDIQPAIPINYQAEYAECNKTYSSICHNKMVTLPCSRNVCQTNSHDGAGPKFEINHPSRHVNSKPRTNAKVFIK